MPTITFKSRQPRAPHPLAQETAEDVRSNNEFPVRFHLTSLSANGEKERHLAILVNGFAERTDRLYTDPHSGLPASLARRGIASSFMPLPFHFARLPRTEFLKDQHSRMFQKPGIDHEKIWAMMPYALVKADKERFYLGYRQVISDLRLLAGAIEEYDNLSHEAHAEQFAKWFDKNTRIHLLGYSLGGLACVAAYLKTCILNAGPRIDTCTLLCSGANFHDLDPTILGIGAREWDDIREYYYRRVFEDRLHSYVNEESGLEERARTTALSDHDRNRLGELQQLIPIFKMIETRESLSYRLFECIVLGTPWNYEDLARVSRRILAIVGEKDPVVRPGRLLGIPSASRHFCVVHIPQLGHLLDAETNWETWVEWCDFVAAALWSFIEAGPGREQGEYLPLVDS